MTEQQTLTAFVAARLDEDEAAAQAAARAAEDGYNTEPAWEYDGDEVIVAGGRGIVTGPWGIEPEIARHIERFQPARVLREVAAKRAILKQYQAAVSANEIGTLPGRSHSFSSRIRAEDEAALDVLGRAVANLAAVYSDHPDYRKEWST
jgi:hypothetical protein